MATRNKNKIFFDASALFAVFFAWVFCFSLAYAQTAPPPTPAPTTPAMQGNSASQLFNPIPTVNGTSTIADLLATITKGFLGIGAIWAVALIVISSFKLVMSQGKEESVTAAKKGILWAVLGLVIAIMAFALISIVENIIGAKIHYF